MKPGNLLSRSATLLSLIGSLLACTVEYASAQLFTEVDAGLTNHWKGCSWWADYDNDGDLDVLITGIGFPEEAPVTELFRQDPGGTFNRTGINFRGFQGLHSTAWGDFDADGDLDIVLVGNGNAAIYRNNGDQSFTELSVPIQGLHEASVAWGDYDNDGDLDLLVTGVISQVAAISRIYRNEGGGTFQDSGISLPGITFGVGAWGDYDRDGDLDIALIGAGIGKVYRNNGNNSFTDISAPLPPLGWAACAWGDYDNDGDLDLAIQGHEGPITSGMRVSRIYRNDAGIFTDINAPLVGIAFGSVTWADYDSDGDLDLVSTGATNGYSPPRFYQNNNGLSFQEVTTTLPVVIDGRVNWADYDYDGDLDLLVGGAWLYRNNNNVSNAVPSAPGGLTTSVFSNAARLGWMPSGDGNQSAALTYNLNVRTAGGTGVVASMSDLSTGWRRVPQPGNAATSWVITNLPPGAYYWTVQAIDHSLAGSEFASEQFFSVGAPWIASIAERPSNGFFEIALGGQVGLSYLLQYSDDLLSWATLTRATISNGLTNIVDNTSPPSALRFYRARTE